MSTAADVSTAADERTPARRTAVRRLTDGRLTGRRLIVRPDGLGRRRPVLGFVAVVALLCLVLFAVGRSGVAAPQVTLDGGMPVEGGLTHQLTNQGVRPVEVVAVTGGPLRLVPEGTEPGASGGRLTMRYDDLSDFAPFTLPGGATRTLAVPAQDDWSCVGQVVEHAQPIRVDLRSADLGLRRTVVIDHLVLSCG